MMVAAVDLSQVYKPASGEISGLWTYLQQIVGQPFLFFRQVYAEELTLHLGPPIESASVKLRRRVRGSYVLTLRGSIWALVSGPQHSLVFADPGIAPHPAHARRLDLSELEKSPPIEVGTPVVTATPFLAEDTGGIGLLLGFADQSRAMIRPSADKLGDADSANLPQIADWELFTPLGRYLRVGPGQRWEYLPSRGDEDRPGNSEGNQPTEP